MANSEKELKIGERIRLYRGKNGITQEQFAKMVNVSRESIIKIEQGRPVRSDTEYRINQVLESE